MKVNQNNLQFIDDVAKRIFVNTLNDDKYVTPEQFKSLASNSYHLASLLAFQRDEFLKTQNFQTSQNSQNQTTSSDANIKESFATTHVLEPTAKIHKVKVEPKEKVVEMPLKAVASSTPFTTTEITGDVVQKRKRGRPPKAKTAEVIVKTKKK